MRMTFNIIQSRTILDTDDAPDRIGRPGAPAEEEARMPSCTRSVLASALALAALPLILAVPSTVDAQETGAVTGNVTAAASGELLPGVTVRVPAEDAEARTDGTGRFTLAGLPAGEVELVAVVPGFREVRRTVRVRSGEQVRVTLRLQEDPDAPEYRIDPMTVTATRTPRRSSEVPSSVSVVQGAELERLQAQSVDDVLRDLPNVTTVGGPRGQAELPQIRGFGADRILFRVDGARQNFTSGHKGRIFLDPALLKRVEVVRGPSSALHGNGGIGGVVSFETRDAADMLRAGETAGYIATPRFVSANEEWGGFGSAFGQTGEVDYLAGFSLRSAGDIELGTGRELPFSGKDTWAGLAKVGWEPTSGQRIEASWNRFSEESTTPLNANTADTVPSLVGDRESFRETLRLGYSLRDPANRWVDLSVTGYRNESEVSEERLSDGRSDVRNVATWGVNASNTSRFPLSDAVETSFTYGGEYYRDDADGVRNDGDLGSFPEGTADFAGLFLQNEWTFLDRIRLLPGLRWESYDQESADPDTPANSEEELALKMGAMVDATRFLSVYGSWSEGFNAPRLLDLFISGLHFPSPPGSPIPNNFFTSNPGLEPERSETWEVGGRIDLTQVLGGPEGLLVEGTYFQTDAEDFIAREVNIRAGTTTFRNLTEVDAEGVEARLRYEGRRIFGGLGYGQVRMRDLTAGEPVNDAPADTWVVDLGTRWLDQALTLGVRGTFAEEQDRVTDPEFVTTGYGVADFYAGWEPRDGPLSGFGLRLRVDNALDEDYRRHASFVPAAGRSVRLEITRRGGFQ